MKIFSMLTVALLIIFQTVGFAASETFSASGEYLMSDYDTPEIAEEIAIDFAKQSAAEQAGIYLESYSRSVNFDLEVDEIKTVASSKVEVLEKNISRQFQSDGRILLRADIRATVDTSELDNFLSQAREQRQQAIQRYKDLQEMNAKIKQDIDEFQLKLAAIKDAVKDDDLIVEQERINREFLSKQKLEEFGAKLVAAESFSYDMTLIDEAINLNPKNVAAYVQHGIFISFPFPDENNINSISKAIIINPNASALYAIRGSYYTAAKLLKELAEDHDTAKRYLDNAFKDYDTAIKLDPKNSWSYVARAVGYESLEEYDKALADYNKAIELDPKNKEAYQARGDLYSKLKDPVNAAKDYELSGTDENKKFDGFDYVSLGDKYKEANDYSHAIENYTKAIEMEPEFAYADHRFSAYNARATVYIGQGKYDKALSDCDAGINLAKKSSDKRAEFWSSELESRKKEVVSFQNAQNIDLKDEDALFKRAFNFCFVAENYNAALNDINAVINLNPQRANAYYVRAKIYERTGKLNEALADYDKALEIYPDYSSVYEERQELLKIMNIGNYTADVKILTEIADSFRENEDYNRALETYTEILNADAKNEYALFWRAWVYYELDDNEKVLDDLSKLIELNPNYSSDAYNNRACAYENLGEYDKALADYDKALEIDPDNEVAKNNRQSLLDKMKK